MAGKELPDECRHDRTEKCGKKPFVLPQPTLSKEEFAERIAEIRRKRSDPEYIARIERAFAGAEEVRRQIDEQYRQWLDEQDQERKLTQ